LTGNLPTLDAGIAMLKSLMESNQIRQQIERDAVSWIDRLGPAWGGIEGDWNALEKYVHSVVALRKLLAAGKLSPEAAMAIVPSTDRAGLRDERAAAGDMMAKLEHSWRNWLSVIASDDKHWLGTDWREVDLQSLAERLSPLPKQLEPLADWVDFHQLANDLSNGPLASFASYLLSPAASGVRGRAANAFQRHFFRLWVEDALSQRKSLRAFRGQDHESLISRFRSLDQKWLELTRHRLAARLASHRPQHQPAHRQSKLGLLQAEFRKKTRHMALRKVLAAAGEVVQSIKPCFMMSPMSVAQYLAPGGIDFDVVVFDEASQVEPADAYGAIARGKQLLLVGDERQLPPTDFFSRADRDDPDAPDHDDFRAADLESVLSLGIVRLQTRCGLRWHYRSRHSSLIEFSNQKFYDGALRVFPSPHTDCSEMGLAFQFIDNAVYNRGAGRHNPVEATAVARAVIRHAIEHPELSLGVGTLNQPQQKAIEDEIEHLRRSETDERVEAFIAAHAGHEPFFVKNLENIQGDERDVIFLSVGFGKDAAGRMSLNFGALNDEGGWRRLNVLVTRARRRCVVFSSIRHDDINLGNTDSRGVAALKEYLYAAEHGHLKDEPRPGKDHDSEFEAAVCRALRDRGWEVHAQVGCAGFAIDLAVVDPKAPGRYLLGIECDGATYHSSATARDRDRLRQSVLEGLGWQIHRVWSTDWFHRPATVLEALLARLNQLKSQSHQAAAALPPAPVAPHAIETLSDHETSPANGKEVRADLSSNGEPSSGVEIYRHHRDAAPRGEAEDLLQLPIEEMAEIIKDLVQIEGPIHREELMRAAAEMYQGRISTRLREKFERAIDQAIESGSVSTRELFLWPPDARQIAVRHRGGPCPVTKAELIPPEEIEAAVRLVLRQQFGLKSEAAVESTARLMGYARTGAKLKTAIEGAIERLTEREEIKLDASQYVTFNEA
jgi:very-short-patch-repair endonuclease